MVPKEKKNKMSHQLSTSQQSDWWKWLFVAILLVGGIWGNFYYADVALSIRASVWIVLLCVIAGVVWFTDKGQISWRFLRASRGELRKVVWPNRKETTQMTIVVVIIVLITSLFLWGIDTLLLYLISHFSG